MMRTLLSEKLIATVRQNQKTDKNNASTSPEYARGDTHMRIYSKLGGLWVPDISLIALSQERATRLTELADPKASVQPSGKAS